MSSWLDCEEQNEAVIGLFSEELIEWSICPCEKVLGTNKACAMGMFPVAYGGLNRVPFRFVCLQRAFDDREGPALLEFLPNDVGRE